MYYSAGYYLIIPKHQWGTVNGHRFQCRSWSVSSYISDLYPGIWGFAGMYGRRELPKYFKPTDLELAAIHSWIDIEFDTGNYGWPGFFLERNTAVEFRKRFLSTLPAVQLVGIFLHESHCAVASKQIQSSASESFTTLFTLLHRQTPEPGEGKEIGFDLLGLLNTGGYEPFSYHVLEQEYKAKFSVELNSYGLFHSEMDCQLVAAYTDTVADEPAVWLPFKTKLFDSHLF